MKNVLAAARSLAAVDVGGVVAGSAVDAVTFTAAEGVDRVVARSCKHPIAAGVGPDLVIAGPAEDAVAPTAARYAVGSEAAADQVAAVVAEDRVVAGAAEDAVSPGASGDVVAPEHVRAAGGAQDVGARATEQSVGGGGRQVLLTPWLGSAVGVVPRFKASHCLKLVALRSLRSA